MQLAKHTHNVVYIELDGARQVGGWEQGVDGGNKGREGGSDDVREGASGSGGRRG